VPTLNGVDSQLVCDVVTGLKEITTFLQKYRNSNVVLSGTWATSEIEKSREQGCGCSYVNGKKMQIISVGNGDVKVRCNWNILLLIKVELLTIS
jgi:hypothetical protein